MFVGEVVGNVWATRKHPSLDGRRLLLVRPIDPFTEEPFGDAQMAVEGGVGAGPGSIVLVNDEGGGARAILKDDKAPVRAVIIGIVDSSKSARGVKKYD